MWRRSSSTVAAVHESGFGTFETMPTGADDVR